MSFRRIEPFSENLSVTGAAAVVQRLEPNRLTEPMPKMELVDPGTLLVDDTYQRDMAKKSIKLIRKIISEWSWRKFKPPIVTQTEHGLVVIDGQHTATAAATHPDVKYIPVLVVSAETVASQADGFIGHNRDRINVTPMQLFHSLVAAEDPAAVTVQHVCDQAGVRILRNPSGSGKWPRSSTISVNAIQSLVRKRYTLDSRRVLSILAKANLSPITAMQIKAVDSLLFDNEFRHDIPPDEAVSKTIERLGNDADHEASVFSATHGIPIWKALTIVYLRALRRRRAAA